MSWEKPKKGVMSPLKGTLSLMKSKANNGKGQVACSPDESGDLHNFEGVIGRTNVDQRLECVTGRRNGVQTKWSRKLNGEYGMSEV